MQMKRAALGAALACAAMLAALPAQAAWRGTWGASPALPLPATFSGPPQFRSPQINGQTVVEHLRLSAPGQRLRLRLSNEFGEKPLQVGHVRLALEDQAGAVVPGSEREVAFAGARSATIPPLSPLVSDPVDLATPARARLRVSLYFPGEAGPCTCHAGGQAEAQISPPGDFTDKPFTPAATTQARTFLSGVEVDGPAKGPVIVAFGDSITDGAASTVGADARWPDRLAERLAAQPATRNAAVVNAGIGGNRVLSAGSIPIFGIAALARFDRDVLAVPGASHLIVLEGVNDMGAKPTPDPQALIGGYRQLVARAHAAGIKVYLATVLPYEGAAYFRPEGEAARTAVNAWIRGQREADGVIDLDAAVRDPADPARLRKDYQSGDWLHPNDAGYRAMGDAIRLGLFR
jgi:lysophospholipase L1-like esterase